ncbi:outer membrane beta-barrel protein [bacterium SCSIO 12643]|nr:outer membrane beta-barrel protein [bacterium SCSIO 12643]
MKQYGLLIAFICITNLLSHGQGSKKSFRDELTVSLNRTVQLNKGIEPRYSFGFGAKHIFMANKIANILLGVEYNCIRFHSSFYYQGLYYGTADLNYKLHYLSVPLGIRINLQDNPTVFVETGVYMDFILNSNVQGTTHIFIPSKYGGYINSKEIDESIPIESNTGIYFAAGVKIPISKFELLIKPDFKLGFAPHIDRYTFCNHYFRLNLGVSF